MQHVFRGDADSALSLKRVQASVKFCLLLGGQGQRIGLPAQAILV